MTVFIDIEYLIIYQQLTENQTGVNGGVKGGGGGVSILGETTQ